MLFKHDIVVFTKLDAKIIRAHRLLPGHDKSRIAISPDLSKLGKIPTHFWKLERGRVIEMSRPEKLRRLKAMQTQREIEPLVAIIYPKYKQALAALFGIVVILGVLAWKLGHK